METPQAAPLTRREKIASGEPRPFLGQGQRKKRTAEARKEARKTQYVVYLNDVPTSTRKMRLVADLVRGVDVQRALAILKLHPRHASVPLYKLVKAAINSYEEKSGLRNIDELFIKTIMVDGGPMLKRMRPAPQGRGYRVRKRSNHVTLQLGVRGVDDVKLPKADKAPAANVAPAPATKAPKAKAAGQTKVSNRKPAAK